MQAGPPWTLHVPTPFHPIAPPTPVSATQPSSAVELPAPSVTVVPNQYSEVHVKRLVFFKIDNKLFSITENALRLSSHFRGMLDSADIGEPGEGTEEYPIILNGVTASEMESFLTLLSARVWAGPPELDEDGWAAALHIATMYSFRDIRNFIIKHIDDRKFYDPVRLIEMANRSNVPKWIEPAYLALCMKPEMITTEEAQRLGIPTFTALCRIREQGLKKVVSGVMSRRMTSFCHHPPPQPSEMNWGGPWPMRQSACDQCVDDVIKTHAPETEYIRLIRAAPELNVTGEDEQQENEDSE
ncbi:hypothetical protein FRC04_002149 [Tulasnella sp. 424]|nr:hypothetical protein FRC04_002149 [Tulasnella sp. 424]